MPLPSVLFVLTFFITLVGIAHETAVHPGYDLIRQGAGGGGFLLLYVPVEKQPDVKKKLSHLLHVPFRFESNGSQGIFYDRYREYKEEELSRSENSHTPFVELKDLK